MRLLSREKRLFAPEMRLLPREKRLFHPEMRLLPLEKRPFPPEMRLLPLEESVPPRVGSPRMCVISYARALKAIVVNT